MRIDSEEELKQSKIHIEENKNTGVINEKPRYFDLDKILELLCYFKLLKLTELCIGF